MMTDAHHRIPPIAASSITVSRADTKHGRRYYLRTTGQATLQINIDATTAKSLYRALGISLTTAAEADARDAYFAALDALTAAERDAQEHRYTLKPPAGQAARINAALDDANAAHEAAIDDIRENFPQLKHIIKE